MPARRILITGVSSYLGTELARRLEGDRSFGYVAALDDRPPLGPLDRTDFIEADLRDPSITTIVPRLRVDTIVHNKILRRPGRGMSPQAAHDMNVIGSLQLLAACEQSPTVRTIVIRGSAGIYGAEPQAPQFFTEEMASLYPHRTRFQRDVGEIENYFATFSRRYASVTCTMLRYQPAIGPGLDTQITRYLRQPVVPTYLGFDPRIQLVHERDATDALVAAVKRPVSGAVNVAGPGTIGLTRMVRMAGKVTLPLLPPLFEPAVAAGRRLGAISFSPDFRRLVRYGRAVDISRLVEEVGYRPRFSTEDAVADYVRGLRGGEQDGVADDRQAGKPAGARA